MKCTLKSQLEDIININNGEDKKIVIKKVGLCFGHYQKQMLQKGVIYLMLQSPDFKNESNDLNVIIMYMITSAGTVCYS